MTTDEPTNKPTSYWIALALIYIAFFAVLLA